MSPNARRRLRRDSSGRASTKGLARRDLVKMGVLAAGGFLIGRRTGNTAPPLAGLPPSPPLNPFVEPLPIPPVLLPVTLNPAPAEFPVAGEAPRAPHQFWNRFLPQRTYQLEAIRAQHSFHPQLPLTEVWSFNGFSPGPTIQARYGEPVVVRFRNSLPPVNQFVGFGRPEITVHLHNAHTATESDGHPTDFYAAPLFKDNHYANVFAGFASTHPPNGDPAEALGTLWYHDHRVEFTAPNVYRGLAGFYLLFDDLDTGDERTGLQLPSGEFDVPMIFVDRRFNANGSLFFDTFGFDGFLGDKFTVNGKIQPFFRVARRKYRLHLLNGGPSRFYEFFLSNGQPFIHISSDGNLLPQPIVRQSVRLAVAERIDVIVDFSGSQLGQEILLLNRLEQDNGRGPDDHLLSPNEAPQVLKFIVDREAIDRSVVPTTLRALPVINPAAAAATRTWRFERTNGQWAINGQFFNGNVVRAAPRQN